MRRVRKCSGLGRHEAQALALALALAERRLGRKPCEASGIRAFGAC